MRTLSHTYTLVCVFQDTSGGSGVVTEGQILRSEIERLKAALVDRSVLFPFFTPELPSFGLQFQLGDRQSLGRGIAKGEQAEYGTEVGGGGVDANAEGQSLPCCSSKAVSSSWSQVANSVFQGGDLGAIAAFVGDSTVPADLGATASLRHHPVPMTVGGPRVSYENDNAISTAKRSCFQQRLTEDLVGMGGPSSMADQLQVWVSFSLGV